MPILLLDGGNVTGFVFVSFGYAFRTYFLCVIVRSCVCLAIRARLSVPYSNVSFIELTKVTFLARPSLNKQYSVLLSQKWIQVKLDCMMARRTYRCFLLELV